MYKLFIFSLVSLYANFSFGAVCDTVCGLVLKFLQ
mgnify:CR=1 FL=1